MKIIYWTTACLEPKIEAVSKEVFELAENFRDSLQFSVTPHLLFEYSVSGRYVGFNSKLDLLLRILIPLLEQKTDINHVYSETSPWIYYKTLKKKPIVLTIASEKGHAVVEFLERSRSIAVQTEGMKKRLLDCGVEKNKIFVVYPGIDLSRFVKRGSVPDCQRPKILFATAPRSEEELAARGVFFIIEVAKYYPEVDIRLLFRPWRTGHSSLSPTLKLIKKMGINNIHITDKFEASLEKIYAEYHFTVIPYTQPDGGKECPRSLIESLACGVPVLISEVSPFASFVLEHKCGMVFPLTLHGFAESLEQGLSNYRKISENASICARKYFDRRETFRIYESIYQNLI